MEKWYSGVFQEAKLDTLVTVQVIRGRKYIIAKCKVNYFLFLKFWVLYLNEEETNLSI